MTQLNKEVLELNFDNYHFRLVWYFYGYLTSKRQDILKTEYHINFTPYYLLGANNFSTAVTDVVQSTEINFKDKKVTPSCLYSVGQMMSFSITMWSLSFIQCDIHLQALELLMKSLQSAAENVSINKLTIKDLHTHTHDLLVLASKQPILEQLIVQHKHPSPSFISFRRNDILLSIMHRQHDNLQTLSLINVSLGFDGAQQIASGLQPDCTNMLKQIILKRNNLGPEGIEVLARSLQNCKLLTKLCISYNNVKDSGAYVIADYITSTKLLEALEVVDNTLSTRH